MKKIITFLITIILSISFVLISGCKTKSDIVTDDKTINVRLYKAGFGDLFIYDLKQKFEELYAEEGYKVNILTPTYGSKGTAMIQEMSRGYKETQIDLYITGDVFPNQVSKLGEYGEVCEDIEEIVFNQTAINYNGQESEEKISERIYPDFIPFLISDDGIMYGFTWAQTSAGMVVNTTKLKEYGITELPRTTDELFDIFDKVYNGIEGVIGGSKETKTFPITYNLTTGLGGAASYQVCAIESWLAQYDMDAYNEFLRMQRKEGDSWVDLPDAYKVYENENIREVLEVGYKLMDLNYSAYGSSTQTLDQAQGLIMKEAKKQNNAIFMLNGDWFLNEVKTNYSARLDDIEFMNVPVISSLGKKMFGMNSSYKLEDEECDKLLSYICKLVDENKTLNEIKESVLQEKGIDLALSDVEAVAKARGICFSRGIEHQAFITKGCTKKEIAVLLLRMMASDDFAETFLEKANASSPYTRNVKTVSKYKFVNEAKNLATNIHFRAINARKQGLRIDVLKSDYLFPSEDNLALTMYNKASSKSYEEAADELYQNSINLAKTAWETYLASKK